MEVMFAEQEDGYRREKEYLQQLRVCIRASKRVSGVDLLTHLNQVFKAAQGQNVFLGAHALYHGVFAAMWSQFHCLQVFTSCVS